MLAFATAKDASMDAFLSVSVELASGDELNGSASSYLMTEDPVTTGGAS
jgi:hypothetical protein